MSEFFKALEQAERDRALGQRPRPPEAEPGEVEPAAPEVPMAEAQATAAPAVEQPRTSMVFKPPVTRQVSPPEVRRSEAGVADGIEGHLVSLVSPTTFEAEQYRTLRHMVEQLHTNAQVSIIACTSPSGGDGKTTTAINLAGALAQAHDTKVLLVETDLRRPTLARELTLGDAAGPGLVGAILKRELTLEDVVRRRPPFTLSILPAGSTVANPYELLKSPRLGELMEQARRRYDYVVVDTPPLVGIPDCRGITPCVDGFLVIVAAHRTPRRLVEEALNTLEPAKILGLVFNRDDRPLGGYSGYAYGYGLASNGHPGQRWSRTVKRARNLLQRRRAPRIR